MRFAPDPRGVTWEACSWRSRVYLSEARDSTQGKVPRDFSLPEEWSERAGTYRGALPLLPNIIAT
jgi:hypothetical protein